MTLLFTDPLFQRHLTGLHPETPKRLAAILADPVFSRLAADCAKGSFAPLPAEEVAMVHSPQVAERAKKLCAQGGGRLEVDTVCSPESYDVALNAAGAACAAVDAVMKGEENNAFCLIRPPGHHATPTESMGFCLFNNIALAAEHAKRRYGLSRILIVDWDVHHGNGTQDIFWADSSVFFLSTHRFPFYPGSGRKSETGTGPGLGFTLNIPLKHGISKADYHAAFNAAVSDAADKIRPELVLVSAGFDAHKEDPVGSLSLEAEDFAAFTNEVMSVAKTHAKGRLVSLLEGGYSLRFLPECAAAHLGALMQGT